MKYLSILLLIGFVGLAVFGAFGMNHGNGPSHDIAMNDCIASTVKGVDCPIEVKSLDFVVFHIDAFKSFSLATLGEDVVSVLLLSFVSLFFIGLAIFSSFLLRRLQLVFYRCRFLDSFSHFQEKEFIGWLALHENSPAFP